MKPTTIVYNHSCDVLTAEPPHARLRIEITRDAEFSKGECSLVWENDTPIRFTVHKPHDRAIEHEATDVLAAVYWSRARSALGEQPGEVHIVHHDASADSAT